MWTKNLDLEGRVTKIYYCKLLFFHFSYCLNSKSGVTKRSFTVYLFLFELNRIK